MPTTAVTGTFWQATQPVSASALPLPNGAATETTLAAVNGKLPALSGGRIPVELPSGGGSLTDTELRAAPVPVSQVSPFLWRVGFAEVGAGLQGSAAAELELLKTGAGMAVSQSAGNLAVTTGVTANAETVFRSVDTFRGSLLARYQLILSQRIVNQTFRIELADLIGADLAYTINSTTSVTVTFPTTNPFTAANVGQSLRLAVLSSVGIPGRYAIASVSGLTVTFTVAGFPASGSGTLTLYGFNWMAAEYSGTVATNALIDAQRRGWASGNTTATISTTASPGHVGQFAFDVMSMGYADSLAASNAAFQWTGRASRITNVPDEDVQLYLFLVIQNGSTAPASTTTATIRFMSVEDQPRNKVRVSGSDPCTANALPVQLMGGIATATQPISGTVTATVTPPAPATPYILNSAATENAALILTGTSGLQAFYATNTGATIAFVKLYNKATTAPTSADIPAMILPVPAAVAGVPGVCTLPIGFSGFRFALGLGIRITGAVADNDTTAVAAGQVKVMLSRTV
jgi:hypothetical protein